MTVLQAVHLVTRFSGITVVNDVSFEVRPDEVVGYLGAERSGQDHHDPDAHRITGPDERDTSRARLVGQLRELPAAVIDLKVPALLDCSGSGVDPLALLRRE